MWLIFKRFCLAIELVIKNRETRKTGDDAATVHMKVDGPFDQGDSSG